MLPEIDPVSLRSELDGLHPPRILDVREREELSVSRVPDDVINIPLVELPVKLASLESNASYVVVCRVGGRSAQATAFLLGQGFTDVRNLAGGMNAYSREVDPKLPIY